MCRKVMPSTGLDPRGLQSATPRRLPFPDRKLGVDIANPKLAVVAVETELRALATKTLRGKKGLACLGRMAAHSVDDLVKRHDAT